MAKKIFFLLLLGILTLELSPICATNVLVKPEKITHTLDDCDAPPPTNFQVVNISFGYVNLSWVPNFPGATHKIVVYREENTGNWTTIATYSSVPGASYGIPSPPAGSYKATIATNCTTGGTGQGEDQALFRIIDLTTAGRIPLNPTPVDTCGQIDYLNHKWVGFKVTEKATGIFNFFEFKQVDKSGIVKRVMDNPIVAVANDGSFPIGGQILEVLGSTFRMEDKSKLGNNKFIGYVLATYGNNGQFPYVGLCINVNNPPVPWKTEYEFVALTAEGVVTEFPGGTGQGLSDPNHGGNFIAQSPFTNDLKIFVPKDYLETNEGIIDLLDVKGQLILSSKFNFENSEISFQTEFLLPGLYFLQVKTIQNIQTISVLKF